MNSEQQVIEFEEEDDGTVDGDIDYSQAVVSATDWTTETIVSQTQKGNVVLNPRFQRRDAWTLERKSRFIESLILGIPVPQIVLAEANENRGSYLVLDGKQRLLSLRQFWAIASGSPKNGFRLTGLEIRRDLAGLTFADLKAAQYKSVLTALENQSIRTVVIKNWPGRRFLHVVFRRLNTESAKLSPQELRQSLYPGSYSNFLDDRASGSAALRALFGSGDEPDPRMRDVEVLARFLGFALRLDRYAGRMKEFLDETSEAYNRQWVTYRHIIEGQAEVLEHALESLFALFGGPSAVARKPGSYQLNRVLLDALLYYTRHDHVRSALKSNREAVLKEYKALFANDHEFVLAAQGDTAAIANTAKRLAAIGGAIERATGLNLGIPYVANGQIKTT